MVFKKVNWKDDDRKRHALGAASSGFEAEGLDIHIQTTIKLIYYVFHTLDRNMIIALEKSLRLSAPHRRNVRKLIAKISEQPAVLSDYVKPFVRKSHCDRYSVFQSVCEIMAFSELQDEDYVRRIERIGRALGLEADEINRSIQSYDLAA